MRITLINALVWIALLGWTQTSIAQISKTMRRLPDTGQTQSFTNTPGEDADFAQNPPFFTVNGNGTVTDTVTGLMWQQTDGGEMTLENAVLYCENLTLGGFSDWRLPKAREAYAILNQGLSNPAMEVSIFPNTNAEYWWTSEHDATNANKIWVTNKGGGVGNHLKTETISAGGTKKFHVRAVRDQQTPAMLPSHFSDNGDGTITDHLTDLIWQKTPVPDSMTWENALLFAGNFTLAGHDDWRVPNIKELQSLCEASLANPTVSTAFFPEVGVKKYWSGTSLPNQTQRAWYLDTRFGITTYADKTGKLNLLCVRSGQSSSVGTIDQPLTKTEIMVYPNPFSAHIFLKNEPENEVYQLSDALGQLIFSGKNITKQDFSKLSPGVYFLRLESKNGAALRLIKI